MLPDALPSLSAGAHDADAGEACVMEYVSMLAGEEWSDRPECTHPLLAHEARTTNDLLRDGDRGRLVPLVGRLFGTTDDSDGIRAAIRLQQARNVMALLEPSARPRVQAAVDRAETWLGIQGDESDVRAAFAESLAVPVVDGGLDRAHHEFHVMSSRLFPFAMDPSMGAAEAYALLALVTAHRVAAAGECRADCASGPARARRMVVELGRLVDAYDTATGREASTLRADEAVALAREVH